MIISWGLIKMWIFFLGGHYKAGQFFLGGGAGGEFINFVYIFGLFLKGGC